MIREEFTELHDMALQCLERDIFPFWFKYAFDTENGGFYGEILRDGTQIKDADKGLIANARILWTFSESACVLGQEKYLDAADYAYAFLKNFVDAKDGGCFFTTDCKGVVKDRRKPVYANAFALYAFSAYYLASKKEEALEYALRIFRFLEAHAYLQDADGYAEMIFEDGSRPEDQHWDVNVVPEAYFTMNTHLHLLEAYTGLVKACRTEETENAMKKLIRIMLTKVCDTENAHLHMYFDKAWQPVGRDISYGHDIEASWLMTEAALISEDETLIKSVKEAAVPMAAACVFEGQLKDGSMINEFHAEDHTVDMTRVWWVQAETVVGTLNAFELSGDDSLLKASVRAFYFIDTFQVDHVYGEWHPKVLDCGRIPDEAQAKIDAWKAPYHNGRMCLEVLRRVSILNTP